MPSLYSSYNDAAVTNILRFINYIFFGLWWRVPKFYGSYGWVVWVLMFVVFFYSMVVLSPLTLWSERLINTTHLSYWFNSIHIYTIFNLNLIRYVNLGFLIRSRNFGCLTNLLIFMSWWPSVVTILPTGALSRHFVYTVTVRSAHDECNACVQWTVERVIILWLDQLHIKFSVCLFVCSLFNDAFSVSQTIYRRFILNPDSSAI
jgi:hypothetical protein